MPVDEQKIEKRLPERHFPIRELLFIFDKILNLESNCQEGSPRVLDKTFGL
jgi:hypothetical protein